ncbi:unnamed protein product [Periconia digitata]|uniref:Translation initiation factor 3 N-terminal domain-containing protein n=1 Tax=Periconia digitata TaxID=1303443 RepID=A0A9W4UAK2_9PLEO|nr:unnamed protein product [Periconia digitata]
MRKSLQDFYILSPRLLLDVIRIRLSHHNLPFHLWSCFLSAAMSRYHFSSTSRALYRIFIAPTLATPGPFRLQHTFLVPQAARLLPQIPTRGLKTAKRPPQRYTLTDAYTLDKAIDADYIDYVDLDGVFHENVYIHDVFSSYNRVTHYLLLVTPASVDEAGNPKPGSLPVCKIVAKIDLRMQFEKKVAIERRTQLGKGVGPSSKNLELNWAIEAGDLKHRLNKMRGFLEEGRKVEVLIGPKRKGRVATEQECENLLQSMKSTVQEIKGARQVTEPEGAMGGVMTFVFEGQKLEGAEEKEENEKKKDKVKLREEKKAENKLRQEKKDERRRKMQETDPRHRKDREAAAVV